MSEVKTIQLDPRVRTALQSFVQHRERIVNLCIAVQQIPAPTFDEGKRSGFVQEQFTKIGLTEVAIDPIGNVYGRLAGRSAHTAPIVVSAHSDTVFSAETDLTIRRENGRVYGPGIADNSAGVAGLLTLAATMKRYTLQPERDVWFVVNVGEEGLGDLRGMRAVVDRFSRAAAFIVIEGGMYGYLLHEAIGVKRYEVEVVVEGGHSWSDFGRNSAIHILGNIISLIDGIRVPKSPKTTYNVGVIEGGTSINTIASRASLQLDLRSEGADGLNFLENQFDSILRKIRRRYNDAKINVAEIGNRPAGELTRDHPLVRKADEALRAVGCNRINYLRGSTDANIPLSRNLPAVCIGLTRSANAHRLDEYLDSKDLPNGMQQLLLLTLAAANYR